MKQSYLILCFTTLLLLTIIQCQPIAGKVVVMKDGLDVAIKKMLPHLLRRIQDMDLPPYSGVYENFLLGKIDYELTNLKLGTFSVDNIVLKNTAPNRMDISSLGLSAKLTLRWKYRQRNWPNMSGNGTATCAISKSVISLGFVVELKNDKPFFRVVDTTVSLNQFDIKVEGGGFAGWLIELLTKILKGPISKVASDGIKDALKKSIDEDLNSAIQAAPFVLPIPQLKVSFDLQTPKPTLIQDLFSVFSSKLVFYPTNDPRDPPIPPIPMPDKPHSDNAVQVLASELIVNSLSHALFVQDMMKIVVTDDMIPPESPLRLNTTSLKSQLPDLYEKFPNMLLQMSVAASSFPTITFKNNASYFEAKGTDLFTVINRDGSKKDAFIADIGLSFNTHLQMVSYDDGKKYNLTGEIKDFNISMKLKESFIGQMDLSRLEAFLNIIIGRGFVPSWNRRLKAGEPLPIDIEGLQIFKPEVKYYNGYVAASANVQYIPPTNALVGIITQWYLHATNHFFNVGLPSIDVPGEQVDRVVALIQEYAIKHGLKSL